MSNKICLNKYIGKCNFELTIVICIQMRDIPVYSIAEYYSMNSTCLTEREREPYLYCFIYHYNSSECKNDHSIL